VHANTTLTSWSSSKLFGGRDSTLAAALRVASKQYEIDAIVLSLKNNVSDTRLSQRRAAMVEMLRDLANRIARATDLIIVEP
jgi:hypothetical protein